MSVPNLTNNLIQPQNIVINQVPIPHAIMTNVNANNGIPLTALAHAPSTVDQSNEIKTGIVVETISMAGASLVGVQTVQNPVKALQSSSSEQAQILTKQRLQDLVRDTDSTLNLEDEVEEIILNYVDEFVDRCLHGAALIAKNRHVNTIEVKDVQQFLNRNYNMWTPGFGTDELRPYKRSLTTEAHKQRLALIRKTLKKY
ncbi:hypothetical protein MTP99_011982 [Tenebrio molitor]|jgi:transcription initiation factor TFIID subunit 12|uniref:Transcription initiation factor TFIID subunit 12 domain-containing protein n=1 Tax=Tenebrio molitor TaxID=7067 RepID=A0A8J6LE94_TENMO|nr:hypothetical protein GEV33_004706 [Tenebrio molitor]KAJ3630809.1 hypothetical protein MTP99_011982 [Tenebrio molitor]CAH1370403.1 unnamed protein product [Tenebrio molitor]